MEYWEHMCHGVCFLALAAFDMKACAEALFPPQIQVYTLSGVSVGLVAEDVAFSDAVVECSGVAAWLEYAQVRDMLKHTST